MCVCAAVDSLGDDIDGDDANPRCCAVHCPCADSLFPCSRNKRKIKKGTISCPEFEDAWENWLLASSHMKWKERFPNDLEKVANEESIDTINALLTD